MFWTAGIVLVALAFGQVPAAKLGTEDVEPKYFENAMAKAGSAGDNRIVSGWEAEPGQFPYQALLRLTGLDGLLYGCGGSIVHRNWVVTAAHCTALKSSVNVRAGMVNSNAPVYSIESREWWIYPTFDEALNNVVQINDISIIRVETIVFSELLQPIRIQPTADAFRNYANEVVTASGWGRLWTDGVQPENLNWVYLTAISNFDCGWVYGFSLINDNAICARYYNVTSQSTCQGDSGGPLVYTGEDGVPTLIGIASFVAGGDFGCHSEHPAGFIRPGPFIPWLNEITGLDFNNLEEEDVTIEPPITTTEATTTTTTQAPTTTTEAPSTTTPKPTPEPEEEDDDEDDSDSDESDEDDPELQELLKKLIVKVKVKVKINNDVKRKLKLVSVDKFK